MDAYLPTAAAALLHQTTAGNELASTSNENAYYARFTWSLTLPAWAMHLLVLARTRRPPAPTRAPMARHA